MRSVERQQQLGQVTVAAGVRRKAPRPDHKATTDALLADEERWASGWGKLMQEVARPGQARGRAAISRSRNTDIEEKAADEEIKRAHATDQSIASELTKAVLARRAGQAVQKIFQEQENKLVEKGITQLLDASGIGKALNSGEDLLLGFLPGAPKDKASACSPTSSAL